MKWFILQNQFFTIFYFCFLNFLDNFATITRRTNFIRLALFRFCNSFYFLFLHDGIHTWAEPDILIFCSLWYSDWFSTLIGFLHTAIHLYDCSIKGRTYPVTIEIYIMVLSQSLVVVLVIAILTMTTLILFGISTHELSILPLPWWYDSKQCHLHYSNRYYFSKRK